MNSSEYASFIQRLNPLISAGDLEGVAELADANPGGLQFKGSLLDDYEGKCAMHCAVEQNQPEILRFLISRGVSLKVPLVWNHEELYPIHVAVRNGYFEIFRILFPLSPLDIEGYTILHEAAYSSQLEMFRLIVELSGLRLDIPDVSKWTPIHYAALSNSIEAIRMLVELGSPHLNSLTYDHKSVYHLIFEVLNPSVDYVATINTLWQLGARVHNQPDRNGFHPIHLAAFNHNSVAIEALVNLDSDILSVTTRHGYSALYLAIVGGNGPDGEDFDEWEDRISTPGFIHPSSPLSKKFLECVAVLKSHGATAVTDHLNSDQLELLSQPVDEEMVISIRHRIYFSASLVQD